jgi:hypothetical protein
MKLKTVGIYVVVAVGLATAVTYLLGVWKTAPKVAISAKQTAGPERINEGYGGSQGQVRA